MFMIRYDIGVVRVAVESDVEEARPALERLFPAAPAAVAPPDAVLRVRAAASGFSLIGIGEPYRSDRRDTLVPAVEARIRARYLAASGEAIPLHSSGLLTTAGGAVLFLGEPGAGKTSLLLRAMATGAAALSDEIHLWDPTTGAVEAYPRAYAAKEGTFRIFPELGRARPAGRPSRWGGHRLWYVAPARPAARRARLAALILLSRERMDEPLRPVPQWERLSALLPHAWGDGTALCGPSLDTLVRALTRLPLWRGGAERALDWFLGPASAVARPRACATAEVSSPAPSLCTL